MNVSCMTTQHLFMIFPLSEIGVFYGRTLLQDDTVRGGISSKVGIALSALVFTLLGRIT